LKFIYDILMESWAVYRESAFYMLFGFFTAGILYVFVKTEMISRYFGQGKIKPVFLSALFGIPIPLCSCGVIPAAAGLRRQGASRGATISFLISTPESGIDSMAITYALLDPIMTVLRPVAAFITAIVAGITESFFGHKNDLAETAGLDSQDCGCGSVDGCSTGLKTLEDKKQMLPFTEKIVSGLKYAYVELLGDIGKWFIAGVLLAGLITFLVPDDFIQGFSGNKFWTMLIMLIAGIPMYVCATASTPIAAALILKGLSPGAALVFLMVGPATNIASMSMVSGLLGKRSLAIYLGAIILCSLGMGIFVDGIYNVYGIQAKATLGQAAEFIPHWIELGSAIIFTGLLAYAMGKPYVKRIFGIGMSGVSFPGDSSDPDGIEYK